jgi:hypothetical protein
MSIRITCIKKDNGYHENPHVAISELGWVEDGTNETGRSTRIRIYDWIKNEGGVAYVTDSIGDKAYVTTAISASGTKYVKTIADNTTADNLLKLPECR